LGLRRPFFIFDNVDGRHSLFLFKFTFKFYGMPLSIPDLSELHPRLQNEYQIEYMLGAGGSGIVYRALRRSTGEICAIKFLYRHRVPATRLAIDQVTPETSMVVPMEVYILRRLSHPNIVRLLDYFEDGHFYYVVTEFHGTKTVPKLPDVGVRQPSKGSMSSSDSMQSTDLFEFVETRGRLKESDAKHIMAQLIQAVAYLKSRNVFHLDLKDENVAIDEHMHVKLIDFGSALVIPDGQKPIGNFYGTSAYATPEYALHKVYRPEQNEIWCLGTMFYTMMLGNSPFSSATKIQERNLRWPADGVVSDVGLRMLKSMLSFDTHHRICMQALAASPYFHDVLDPADH